MQQRRYGDCIDVNKRECSSMDGSCCFAESGWRRSDSFVAVATAVACVSWGVSSFFSLSVGLYVHHLYCLLLTVARSLARSVVSCRCGHGMFSVYTLTSSLSQLLPPRCVSFLSASPLSGSSTGCDGMYFVQSPAADLADLSAWGTRCLKLIDVVGLPSTSSLVVSA